ncbi:FmdB family zinc ribbon protein [Plantactinospora siamensis]|uniref:FmdB family zinc ribbon protein n=1 Tax=Plantactinospora siamensis TaxID=555372 RepID=A0ABV6NV81_9ACTN
MRRVPSQDPEGNVPTYQYVCTECGHQLEAVQSFADEPLTVCPSCEGRLRKLFNSVGIVFKGSGFYRTDSRSNGSESAAKDAKPGESGTRGDAAKGGASAGKDAKSGSGSGSSGSGGGSGDGRSSASKPAATSGSGSGSGSGSKAATTSAS